MITRSSVAFRLLRGTDDPARSTVDGPGRPGDPTRESTAAAAAARGDAAYDLLMRVERAR